MDPLFFAAFDELFCFFCTGDDNCETFESDLPTELDFFLATEAVRCNFFWGTMETDLPFLFLAEALALMRLFDFCLRPDFTEKLFFAGIPNTILVRSFFSTIKSRDDFLLLGVAINFTSRSDFLILSIMSLTDLAKGST